MKINQLNQLVLTVKDIDTTCEFYCAVLGFTVRPFGNNRKALHFGNQKIHLHEKGHETDPKAAYPTPGSADLCFFTETPINEVLSELQELNILLSGVVARQGVSGPIQSVYFRDPDGNSIEVSSLAF